MFLPKLDWNLVNLTPHTINLYLPYADVMEDGDIVEIPSEGLARASECKEVTDHIGDVPVYSITYGDVTGVPEPEEGTLYIVSSLVANALKGRSDILIVADTVRDEGGRIIGCRGFARV